MIQLTAALFFGIVIGFAFRQLLLRWAIESDEEDRRAEDKRRRHK